MIGSDVKPIKMQETTEKDSSRPLSSLYVDDADEEDEEDVDNTSDGGMTPRVEQPTVQMD